MRGHLMRSDFRKATELGKRQAARAALNARRSAAATTIQKHARRRIASQKVASALPSWPSLALSPYCITQRSAPVCACTPDPKDATHVDFHQRDKCAIFKCREVLQNTCRCGCLEITIMIEGSVAGLLKVAALRKEAAKWQELEESKVFLETQVAQFRSAKQQEATRADSLAAQVIPAMHWFTSERMDNLCQARNKRCIDHRHARQGFPHACAHRNMSSSIYIWHQRQAVKGWLINVEHACRWRACRASWLLRSLMCRQPASRQRWQLSKDR